MNNQIQYATDAAKRIIAKGDRIIYLTHFGSVLYGTNTEKSDCDLKGIYVPSVKSLILGTSCKHYRYSSGNNNSRNCFDDIDVELYSLQYWLKLLAEGDTGALDLLFSVYAKHIKPIINDDLLKMFMTCPNALFDIRNNKSYIGYAYGQAKKYGIKGSRMGLLKDIIEYLQNNISDDDMHVCRAYEFFDIIVKKFGHESYCFLKEKSDMSASNFKYILYILGKGYCPEIKMTDMLKRLNEQYSKYGTRAKQAAMDQNVDWKAVSHALRCLKQIDELIDTNFIQYPLKDANILKDIKNGKYSWSTVEQIILDELSSVEQKIQFADECKNLKENHEKLILAHYKM